MMEVPMTRRNAACITATLLLAVTAFDAMACPGGGNGVSGQSFCAGQGGVASGALSDWQAPRSVEGVSGYNNECRPSLTADGRVLCFHADAINGPPYDPKHIGTETHVYTAKWTGTRWDSVAMLDSVAGCFGRYPFISADGSKILFQRGVGNQDLYVTRWTGTNWDTARSLGPTINTPEHDECYPFLSPDTHLLYFASNRDPRIGDRDLWVCRWHGTYVDSITNLEAWPKTQPSTA
jgi:hypothetical protein